MRGARVIDPLTLNTNFRRLQFGTQYLRCFIALMIFPYCKIAFFLLSYNTFLAWKATIGKVSL